MARVLEVFHGSDGRMRSALVKTVKTQMTSSETGTHVLRKCFSGEKQGRQCWRQSSAGKKIRFGTWWLRNKT